MPVSTGGGGGVKGKPFIFLFLLFTPGKHHKHVTGKSNFIKSLGAGNKSHQCTYGPTQMFTNGK